MKKLLALTLAMAMVLSLASVAFAASRDEIAFATDDKAYTVKDNKLKALVDSTTYGKKIYYVIEADGNPADVKVKKYDSTLTEVLADSEIADDIKVSAKWQMNGELVSNVDIVPVMLKDESNNKFAAYLLEVATKKMPNETDDADVIGTITLKAPKSGDTINSATEREYDLEVAFNLKNLSYTDEDKTTLNKDKVMSFGTDDNDRAEEEEHEIELYAGMGRFVVNTIGQGDLVVKTNVNYNEGIENVASDVNYVYFNSNNPTFNRLGDLYLNAKEGDVLYRVNKDGSLTKMPTEYDEDEEAFVIRTRVIGSYVIAEEELDVNAVNAAVVAPEAPVAPAAPSNPSTGAAC